MSRIFVLRTPWILAGKFASTRPVSGVRNRVKLLKLQTLRINDDCKDYTTNRHFLETPKSARIEGVKRCGRAEVDESKGLLADSYRVPRERSTIPRMLAFSRAKWIALMGYSFAAAGIVLFTQLGRVVDLRMGSNVLDAAVVCSMLATFGGFVTATVGSAIWARRTPTRQPLKIAALIAGASLFLILTVGVNIHGPSAILMFLVPFSAINILSLLVVTQW